MSVSLDELVDAAEELVKFSATAMAISRLCNDDDAGMPDLVAAVEADVNFAINTLRIANSAAYLRGEPTASVAMAITRIGRRELGQMAFAAACMEGMGALEGKLLELNALWRDGMIIGGIARELCVLAPEAREYSFAAGMLHSIGTMVLSSQVPEQMRRVLEQSLDKDLPLHEAEEQALGFSNASLGGAMARRWNFPEPLAYAIEYQHNPEQAPEHKEVVGVLAIAAAVMEQSLSSDEFTRGDDSALLQMLDRLNLREKYEESEFDPTDLYERARESTLEAA